MMLLAAGEHVCSSFEPGGHLPHPVTGIPMVPPPSVAAATQALVKAVTAAPPKGKRSGSLMDIVIMNSLWVSLISYN